VSIHGQVHHILNEEDPYGIVATFKDVLAPGSMMQLTHFSDASPESKANEQVLKQSLGRGQVRTRAEIAAFFDGLEILEPGIVFLPEWRPDDVVGEASGGRPPEKETLFRCPRVPRSCW
jgi:hypothetical protein